MADHDHNSHEPEPTCRKEKLSPDDQYSGRDRINTHRVNSMDIPSSANFSSMNSAGQISLSSSSSLSNENLCSTIVTAQSSTIVSTQSSKNDISSELGPVVQMESSKLDSVKSEERRKPRTESSCSNSIQITLPVSSSNESYLEMSTDMRSAKPHTSGVNSSISEGFVSSMEGAVTRSIDSDVGSLSSKEVVDTSREGNMNVSGLVRKQNVFLSDVVKNSISNLPKQRSENEVAQLKEQFHEVDRALGTARKGAKGTVEEISISSAASGSIALNQERNSPAVYESFVHIRNSGKSSCLTETAEPALTFSRKLEGLGSSYLDILDQELMKQQTFSNPQPPLKVPQTLGLCELNGLNNGDKSTKSISTLSSNFAAKGHHARPDLFDLNEDNRKLNSHVQSTCETGNHINVIRVVAKPGVPLSVPMTHRKLEGEMSWKGSAATSAFRPTNSKVQATQSDRAPTFSKGYTGIDLNVAAAEDRDEYELRLGVETSPPLILNPAVKVGCSRAETLDFDLNCLGDITDMSQGVSLPTTSVKSEIVDFNLNEGSSSVDKREDCRWQNKPSQHVAKLPSNAPGIYISTNSGGHGLNLTRPAYRTDFNNFQFYNQSQMQSFLMASSNALRPVEQLQKVVQLPPKLPFVIPSLPPQSYPSSGPFFICPNGFVPSNLHYPIPMQHVRDPRVHAAFPQNISHTMVSSVAGAPHFMQVVHGRSQTEVANIRPCMDVANGGIPAVNGSPRDTREFFPPSKCSPVKEQMRVPLKRTEPEGGHETHQLCTMQLTSWN